jgi:hypothetical protein
LFCISLRKIEQEEEEEEEKGEISHIFSAFYFVS